jgi:TolB-like protein
VNNITAFAGSRGSTAGVPREAVQIWKIYLSGPMRVIDPQGNEIASLPRKTRGLLAYLCLAQPQRVSRSRLTALLWDRPDDRARRNLRQALYVLEQLTGAKTAGLIVLDREYVSLNTEVCWIDVFEAPDYLVERLVDGLEGISTPFDQWLSGERSRLEDRLRGTLEAEVERLGKESAPAERRAAAARKLLTFDPTHEGAVCALMTALAGMGEHAQALREYERCRAALRATLDISPSRETIALYEAVRLVSPRSSAKIGAPRTVNLVASNANVVTPDWPCQPSVAVLPFRNLSGVPRHHYTADALAEDLIGLLSRVPGFFVISRLSTRTFRNQEDRLPQEIGDLLDVRYLLSGTMRVAGSRLRVNAELTDAIRGIVLWSAGIEERFFDLFDIPMRLAEEIVRQAAPHLRTAELTRVRSKQPEQLNAYDYFLQAQDDMHNFSPSMFQRAERMFDAALARVPNYPAALAWRAYWHVLRIGQGWSPNRELDATLAAEFAARALDGDPLEPMAFGVQGHIAAYLRKDFNLAFEQFKTALRLNPNAAPVWLWSAATRAWDGDGRGAVEEVKKGTALSPYDPLMYFSNIIAGMAYLTNAQYDRAIEYAYLSLRENRSYAAAHRLLVIGLVLAGRLKEAHSAAHRLITLEPGITVEKFRNRYPGVGDPRAALYCDALAEAGVPRA